MEFIESAASVKNNGDFVSNIYKIGFYNFQA
jgi:hypothetical protein